MARVKHHFTFGANHMCSFPLPGPGHVSDYWVTVDLPAGHPETHREVFIREFTERHCPRALQFSFEYDEGQLKEHYFPGGELCVITEEGVGQ